MKNTLNRNRIPAKDIFYFRQRFKNKIFQSALAYFVDLAKEKNLTKKDIANLLDKDPAQITRWFAGPNNWTLDTISDLLLAMGAELKYEIVSLHENSQQTTEIPALSEHSARTYIAGLAEETNLTRKEIVSSLDKDPAQITRWIADLDNRTLDTISDHLPAMNAELMYQFVSLYVSSQQTTEIPAFSEHSAESGTAASKEKNFRAVVKILNESMVTKNSEVMTGNFNLQSFYQESDAQAAEQAVYNTSRTSNSAAIY